MAAIVAMLLIISHFIGDFVFQTAKLAREKSQYTSKLILHCVIYAIVMFIVLLGSVKFKTAAISWLVIVISHFMIDGFRIWIDKKNIGNIELFTYFIDQISHILICITVVWYFNPEINENSVLGQMIETFGEVNMRMAIIYILIYLSMFQPSAVTIKKVLLHISRMDDNRQDHNENPIYNAGYTIGILERIIIATLVLQNQVSTIGFILAAKSLARYKQLEEQEFAEKYLVGTLSSAAIAILVTLILKSML